jgi:phosphate/sulfate permease
MHIAVMGNKITYHSPSRGSSMEMGAALTVLIFSQYSLPVSTSMCITGATVGVGLCNGTWRAVNWQRIGLSVSINQVNQKITPLLDLVDERPLLDLAG